VLKVPLSALFRQGQQWAVFVDRGGRAHLTEVRIGHENGLEAELVEGLEAGTRVVLHPSDRVVDGVRIRQREPR
jgi:HlyD family secretion protein